METEYKNPPMVINVSFTLYMPQIGKLAEMSHRLGANKSELVRRAIDLFYEQVTENTKEV